MITEQQFLQLYRTEQKRIDSLLNRCLNKYRPESLYEPVIYILNNPGKRLRPFLVLLSARAAGGSFKQVYNAALALEMLHTFTLVHDDIMDNADKRRGNPTLHKKYDLSTAIIAGDSLLAVAYEFLLKDITHSADEIINLFTRSLVEVCEGQGLDKEFELTDNVTLPDYITMITKKTAIMVETCCAIGATIVDGDPKLIRALRSFGKNIGIAFQIQDDLLDISADEKEFGKKIGGDLMEGKKTYLFLKALEKADGKNLKMLETLRRRKGITQTEVPRYKDMYQRLGVLNDASDAIHLYTDKALRNIAALPGRKDKEIFMMLANMLIKRTR